MALQGWGLDSIVVLLRRCGRGLAQNKSPLAGLLRATILNPAVLRLNITSVAQGFVPVCDRQANKC